MADKWFELAAATTAFGGRQVNTHHFVAPDVAGSENGLGLCNAWYNALRVIYAAIFPSNYTLESVSARELRKHNEPQPTAVLLPINIPGTRDAEGRLPLAPWLACRATIYSGRAGRKWRGANIFAGGAEDDVTVEQLSTAATDNWKGRVDAYLAGMMFRFSAATGDGDFVWINFSRTSWLANSEMADTFADVVSYLVRPDLRSDRRRRT